MTPRLMSAALTLVERGWRVFPLRPRDKRPLPRFTKWEARATCDAGQIYRWWTEAPYNLGVATGPSRLLVIDCDTAAEGEVDWQARAGRVAIRDIMLPITLTVLTPTSGLHVYFNAPGDGASLGNTAGRLGRHIDTRGAGGYVVGPGSVVGGHYYRIICRSPVADLPCWVGEHLADQGVTMSPQPLIRHPDAYVRAVLAGETKRICSAEPGLRNSTLNRAAFRLGQLVASDRLTSSDAWQALSVAAAVHVGVRGFTHAEIERTIRSGLRAGQQQPRH